MIPYTRVINTYETKALVVYRRQPYDALIRTVINFDDPDWEGYVGTGDHRDRNMIDETGGCYLPRWSAAGSDSWTHKLKYSLDFRL